MKNDNKPVSTPGLRFITELILFLVMAVLGAAKALEAGCTDYIAKPVRREVPVQKLKEYVVMV